MMKNLLVAGVITILGTVAFAKTTETRAVANDDIKKIKFFEGTSTSYKLLAPANTHLIIIKGDSARNIWRSLSVKQYRLEQTEEYDAYQKVSTNVTCERIHQKTENKHDYQCSISLVDGVVGGGGAG